MRGLILWLPAILWMAIIFYMSHQPGGELSEYMPFFQRWFPWMSDFNWGHFVAYYILACTYYLALAHRTASLQTKLLVIVLSVLYGGTDEFHQLYVADRMADWMDLRNDAIGATLAMVTVSIPVVHRLFIRLQDKVQIGS